MKNMGWLAIAVLGLVACKQDPHYKLRGEFPGMPDGLKVYLHSERNAGEQLVDSTLTSNGCFVLTGKVSSPRFCTINIGRGEGKKKFPKTQEVWVENADIHLSCPWDSLEYNDAQITGSASQDLFASHRRKVMPLQIQYNELYRDYFTEYEQYAYAGIFTPEYSAKGREIAGKQRELHRQIKQLEKDFVKENPASAVSLKILLDILRSSSEMTAEEADGLMALLDPALKQAPFYPVVERQLEIYRKTAKGQKYMDFILVDVNGKEGRFSDYFQPGKYNLLECWASWCSPCRAEIPHLKHVHQLCGKDFNIIAVSVDQNEAEWKKALKEEQPGYLQFRNIKDTEGKRVNDYYGFGGIPYTLLLDGEGRIVEQEVRGAALDLVLIELLGEKAKGL